MDLKELQQIHAKTDIDLYKNFLANVYALDKFSQYVKNSESIIDTENMIIVKSQLDSMSYLGNVILDDNSQIDCFYSQNGVFWFQNLLNQPFNVFNLTQNLTIQDMQLQNNKIALYDNAQKQLILYNVLQTIQEVKKIDLDVQFNLKITITNWDQISFIWVQNEKIYLQSLQANPQLQLISKLESNVSEYYYCPLQKVIVAKSIQQLVHIIQINNENWKNLKTKSQYNQKEELLFLVKCEENIIVTYYPYIQLYDLITGNLIDAFDQIFVGENQNTQKIIPLIDLKHQYNITNLFYDFKHNILIGITNSLCQINAINIPGNNQLFIYETTSQFAKDANYYYQDQTTLIIVDYTPNIYLYNYLTHEVTIFNIKTYQIQGILMDENKNYDNYSTNWWNVPFDYEERYNNNDSQEQDQKLICIVIQGVNSLNVQIINVGTKQTINSYFVYYSQITNIVGDPFRKLIYMVNNQGNTLVFSYTLNLITNIQNACLKQAIISYDSDFVYSICPNDIIIYNGLSFQQQFPQINHGIQEAQNLINTRYNNYFIIIQKFKFSVIQMDALTDYKLIYETNQSYQKLLNMQIVQDSSLQNYLDLLLCSYESTHRLTIPLQQNQTCYIGIQQQNRPLENLYTNITLIQSLTNLQNSNSNQKLTLIEIEYQDGQYLQNQCNLVLITNSVFQNNTNSQGFGGSIYAVDNSIIQINNTRFYLNKCLKQNGGAISIQNIIIPGNLIIIQSEFINNEAYYSTGGAINLYNSNMILQNSTLSLNIAQIGGAIYYEQIIPDFILEFQKGKNLNNIISQNYAKIYGKNFGSTLRNIKINIDDIKVSQEYATIQTQNGMIDVKQFKSGDKIYFKNVQMLDEENNPIVISFNNQSQYIQYSYDVQTIIDSIQVSFQWDKTNQQIQLVGELQSKQFVDSGFELNGQIMFKPENSMTLQIVSNNFPQLMDSKGNIYIQQGQLYQNITIYFDKCSQGQITKQQSNSIICEDCPEGKYSLNINDTVCSQCPDSAIKCYKSTILLKNGYWRENIQTDQILFCHFNPSSCLPESKNSKDYCLEGYRGPLCYTCDTYGELWGKHYSEMFGSGKCYECEGSFALVITENIMIYISIFFYIFVILKNIIRKLQAKLAGYFINKANILFLGSTLRQSDKPQIVSKILTDHLQILSLISCFSFSLPNYFKTPIQLSGNSLSVTSKSIDCLLSKYPILQPLWFYQFLWSLILPFSLFFFYLIYGVCQKYIKKNKIVLNYLNTACIFIYLYFFPMVIILLSRSLNCIQIGDKSYLDLDINIRCFDPKYHKPFIFYLSLPLLFIWAIIIPLFLFIKIKQGKLKKWSIFIEIKYSFIFAGYKEKFYYWEFGKLVYKSLLIIISILMQQNEVLKICLMNVALIFKIFVIFKFKPYISKNFNSILQKSAIICALSLNLSSIIQNISNPYQQALLCIFLIFLNLKYILQLAVGISSRTISSDQLKRSKIENCLIYFKQKYPSLFENIQIENKNKIKSLMKLKIVKSKIKMLVEYFKNNNFYGIESVQQHFNLQRTSIISSKSTQNILQNRFILNDKKESPSFFKKKNSFKNMRDKWNYYTRGTKESPLNSNRFTYEDNTQDYIKEIQIMETGSLQTNSCDQGKQLTFNIESDKKYQEILNLDS
ncbi:transmembrane protein, putative (macronuclear) [Tetrahymena thermophila SB210]|uniref:Transmembrane protein, putative n=1 Tax=Tetrahymena thermophila (strain SB210) TaxID=312017 RepID=Q23MJ9_TETTS|nr:transmembrane protein, putative [Tetrahymena thermophila SB210]EAR97767.3 transmembrane protein, putative [Tetrahymena thermophila SB210]|eukprot:XP_001018012.3 transmembrane protein, putative [Tetrahymena thermophila SB210]